MNRLLLGVSLASMVATAAHAQETSSSVMGSVTASGAAVSGATVTITHVPSGTKTITVTDADGGFNASGLRVGGPFTVVVMASGHEGYTADDISLSAGQSFRLPIELDRQADIVVTGSQRATNLGNGPVSNFNREQIQGIATINRDIRDIARRDPFVTLDAANNRAIEIAGQNSRLNKFSVDGINFSDNFGLNNGGLPTNRGPVPIDAIEQLSVKTAPYDVSEGNFQGGAINVILRSGGNAFSGSGFFSYSSDNLLGDNTRGTQTHFKLSSKNWGAFLSGPIIKDKLFFAFAYEQLQEQTPADIQPGQIPGFTQGTYDQVGSISESTYKYAMGAPFTTTREGDKKYTAKIDWNVTDGQRLSATYIRNEGTRGFQNGVSTSFSSPVVSSQSNGYLLGETVNSGTVDWNSEWGDSFQTEVRGNYRKYVRSQDAFGDHSQGQFSVCTDAASIGSLSQCSQSVGATPGSPSVVLGPDPFRQANLLNTESWGGDFTARWRRGRHNLKAIAAYQHLKAYDLFVPYAQGGWYFDSLADYKAGHAGSLTYGGSTSGNLNDAAADYGYGQYSFSLQDSWDVSDILNVTYGTRYDLFQQGDRPAMNTFFAQRYGFTNLTTYDGKGVFQPRAAFTLKPSRRFSIQGGGGLFSGTSPDVFLANSFQNSGVFANSVTIIRTATGCTGVSADLCAVLDNVGAGGAIPAALATYLQTNINALKLAPVNAIDPKFRAPATWKFSLSADYRLDLGPLGDGWDLGGDFYYSRVRDALTYTDLRSVRVGSLPDGRPRYGSLSGAVDNNQDLLMTNTNRGRGFIYVVRAQKRFDFGLTGSASYTWQDIKDVDANLGTLASSNYGQSASADANNPGYGTSIYQIKHSLKFSIDYDHAFIGDLKTRFSLFGERRSGNPYSYTMADTSAGRSPLFGTLGQNNRYLLYVPNVSSITADSRVVYDSAVTFTALQNLVKGTKSLREAQGSIIGKNTARSPSVFKVDLHVGQELPIPTLSKGRFEVFADVENFLNLLNNRWGAYRQVGIPYLATVVNASCAQSSGTDCTQYRYSSAQSPNIVNNQRYSLWQVRIGGRIKF